MIKKLFSYTEGYRRAMALSVVLITFETICELVLPLIMARIIDVGINGDGGMPYILKAGGLMILISAFAMAGGIISSKFAALGSQGFGKNLRKGMFDQVQEFSFADIDRFSSASLITRITNDANNIQNMLGMGIRIMVKSPVMLVVALTICLRTNARLSLVLLAVIPVMALAIGILMKVCYKLFTIFQEKIDALNDTVQENLIAIRVVKAFVRSGFEKTKFMHSNDELTKAGINAVSRVIFMQPIMIISLSLAIIGVLWFGGSQVANGQMLSGDLYSFVTYISMILMSVLMLAFSLLQLTRARASATRIIEVLEAEPDIRDGANAGGIALPAKSGSVEFQDVSFKYLATGTGDDVLKGIDLKIEPGEFTAIVGGTGVGKSSLVNLIPRFYDVTGGRVLLDGLDVREYPLQELRARIGMVLQNNVLFSGSIRENLLWGKPEATEEELIQAAKNAQAYDFIMSFPDGFDTHIEQGGVNVSGGQKQRLCIARAMLRKPSILILDDSTSAVDSQTEARIRESFSENLEGTTVIIIAQRISSVRYADKIVVLDDDHVSAVGKHEELMLSSEIYQEIYNSQQEGVSE